jgi:hypothetical protein
VGVRHVGVRHVGVRHVGVRHVGVRHVGVRHVGVFARSFKYVYLLKVSALAPGLWRGSQPVVSKAAGWGLVFQL